MELVMVFMPLLIVSGIALYVITSLKHMSNEGKLGKKKSKGAQVLLDSLIPLGMIFGCAIGVVFVIFFPISPPFTISLGAGIGYLIGFFAYRSSSKKGDTYS